MDKNEKNLEKNGYIDVLVDAQRKMPSLILPSMGLISNEKAVYIDGKEIIKKDESKEKESC